MATVGLQSDATTLVWPSTENLVICHVVVDAPIQLYCGRVIQIYVGQQPLDLSPTPKDPDLRFTPSRFIEISCQNDVQNRLELGETWFHHQKASLDRPSRSVLCVFGALHIVASV